MVIISKRKRICFCAFAYDAVGEISKSPKSCMRINSVFIKWLLKYDEPLPLEGETICLRRNKVHQFVLVIPWVIGPSPFNGDCSVQQGAWHTALEGGPSPDAYYHLIIITMCRNVWFLVGNCYLLANLNGTQEMKMSPTPLPKLGRHGNGGI